MIESTNNILFTHSGGPTAIINAVAATLSNSCSENEQLYIAQNGVEGIIKKTFIHANQISKREWERIMVSPASSFGSSRLHLPKLDDEAFYQNLFDYLAELNIHTFICNGGNNSQHITLLMHNAAKHYNYPLRCIGIPKTIDNDVAQTDCCPGFGSAAKYTATSVHEVSLDLASVCHSSTQVLLYETMGRHAGWLAASAALAKKSDQHGPHIILLPEANFSLDALMKKVQLYVDQYHHCVICLAEGAQDNEGILQNIRYDVPGQPLLGMLAPQLGRIIEENLGLRNHVVIPDYLQRSARHLTSKTDLEQAIALAKTAYSLAKSGHGGIMVNIERISDQPYKWTTGRTSLENVAGKERKLPENFISSDQLFVTSECIKYLKPLIFGEVNIPYTEGIPDYSSFIYDLYQSKRD